ncbi:MAG: hypothetical protein PHH54_03290 [Candidatus Nanoarchaeia archaeon]|nr:hypothetical protein [Candidatus Nanoarchaeia archaeon]MDD5740981.1 hypothetical protein [Candidatus Nanoarchaeia archaeon]
MEKNKIWKKAIKTIGYSVMIPMTAYVGANTGAYVGLLIDKLPFDNPQTVYNENILAVGGLVGLVTGAWMGKEIIRRLFS